MPNMFVNGAEVQMTSAQSADLAASQASIQPQVIEQSFTWLEFMDLFTEPEQVELAGAAMTDPTMKLWYDRALGAQGIYLSDERTIAGVNHAAEQGLITNNRRDAVLRGEAPSV